MSRILIWSKSRTTSRWKKPVVYSQSSLFLFSKFDTFDASCLLKTFCSLCFSGICFLAPPSTSVVTSAQSTAALFKYWNGLGLSLYTYFILYPNILFRWFQPSHILNTMYLMPNIPMHVFIFDLSLNSSTVSNSLLSMAPGCFSPSDLLFPSHPLSVNGTSSLLSA